MTRKKIYELNNLELEENINHPAIQKVIKFPDRYTQPCQTLFDSYFACVAFKELLEIEIEVKEDETNSN